MVFTSNISSLPDRPVGVGALIHCSLANQVTDCLVPALRDCDKSEWEAATGGRILRLRVTRPGLSLQWEYIGVYQHVAKAANRSARALLRETLTVILKSANKEERRAMVIGDFNAAPPGGRWGYATGSQAVREDDTMNAWIRANDLTEVLPGRQPMET